MMINTLAKNVKPIEDRNIMQASKKRHNHSMQMKALKAQNITDTDAFESTKTLVELNETTKKRNKVSKQADPADKQDGTASSSSESDDSNEELQEKI